MNRVAKYISTQKYIRCVDPYMYIFQFCKTLYRAYRADTAYYDKYTDLDVHATYRHEHDTYTIATIQFQSLDL